MNISGFEKAINIYDFKVHIAINQHSICTFWADIHDDNIPQITNLAKSEKSTEVTGENGILIMKGIVQNIKLVKRYTHSSVFCTIVSDSIKAERTFNKRIYQDTAKTAKNIIEKNYDYNISFQKADKFNDIIENIVVQDNVSDFDFLVSLAAEYEGALWAENGGIVIGLINNTVSLTFNTKNTREEIINYEVEYSKENTVYCIKTQKYIKNGSKVRINSDEAIICETEITEKASELYFTYTAYKNIDFSQYKRSHNDYFLGRAKVTKNADSENLGRIQTEFLDYENICENSNNAIWLSYLTPFEGKDNCGFMMMPDEGDTVMVYTYNSTPVAVGTLREKAAHQAIQNVEHKTICVGKERIVRFDDTNIFVQNTENSSVTIEDKKISVNVKNGSINIIEDDTTINLDAQNIKAKTKNITQNADENISVNAGKDIAVKADSNVNIQGGSKFSAKANSGVMIDGSSEAKLKGTKIELIN